MKGDVMSSTNGIDRREAVVVQNTQDGGSIEHHYRGLFRDVKIVSPDGRVQWQADMDGSAKNEETRKKLLDGEGL